MKLSINNQNTETKNTVANPAAIVAASQTPAEPIQDAVAEEITDEQPVPKRKAASKRGQSGAGSDAAEREQARPEVKATIKRKVTLKKKQPISKTPQAQPMSEAKPSPSTGERGEGLSPSASTTAALCLAMRRAATMPATVSSDECLPWHRCRACLPHCTTVNAIDIKEGGHRCSMSSFFLVITHYLTTTFLPLWM